MRRIYQIMLVSVMVGFCTMALASWASAAAEDDIQIGSNDVRYVDPEFDVAGGRIAFRDRWGTSQGYVGWLDPADGTLVTETGMDMWLGDEFAPIDEPADNGPEWLLRNGQTGVVFTRREDGVERMYFWMADSGLVEPVMPSVDNVSRTHIAGTMSPAGEGKLLYRRQAAPGEPWIVTWLNLADPSVEVPIPGVELQVSLPTWIGPNIVLYSAAVDGTFQLFRYNTATQSSAQLTYDAFDKLGAYAWSAPEVNDRLLFLAAVKLPGNDCPTRLRVYYQMSAGYLVPVSNQPAPAAAGNHVCITSPEPFVYRGRSFVSLGLFPHDRSEGSIWVFDGLPQLGDMPEPQRVDDPDLHIMKLDPEAYVAGDNAFIYYYYNVHTPAPGTVLRRCIFHFNP